MRQPQTLRPDQLLLVCLLVLGMLLWQPTLAQVVRPRTEAVEAAIKRIEAGLLPSFSIAGRAPITFRLTDRMQYHQVPGFSIAVINGGVVEWAKGYGLLEAGGSATVTEDTRFQAGSISKPLTALAALGLVQEGKLALDEDLNTKLTSWKIPANAFTNKEKITLRRALSHNTGLGDTGLNAANGYPATDSLPTITQILRGDPPSLTSPVVVVRVPGSGAQVSSEGYCIVQQAMMDVTGEPFATLMADRILARVSMTHSTFEQYRPAQWREGVAAGHVKGKMLSGKWRLHPAMAAAGLWSTPSDVARLMIEVGRTRAGQSHKLVDKRWVDSLLTPQPGNEMRGLGYYVHGSGPNRCFYHRGWNYGYTSYSIAFPDLNKGLVLMTNADGEGYRLMMEVVRAVAREYDWPTDLPVEAAPQTVKRAISPGLEVYERLVGRYLLANSTVGEVVVTDGQLYLQAVGKPPVRLYAETEEDYFSEDGLDLLFPTERGVRIGLLFKDPINRYLASRVFTPPVRTKPAKGNGQ
ncbi:serine hydrolase domain-containing protein [Fibrella aquatilis]|uniref:Beta-lactamase family protein n=1 Tax=Fibrella aquatilis TaxID=2817059 RepID=A0A939G9P6_9BACT|nr:serine hydrolase domain-containing protein [Fibrella aquatilis]MBO0933575.1 beta-lactamase family protein [Fibrella aquatilis]